MINEKKWNESMKWVMFNQLSFVQLWFRDYLCRTKTSSHPVPVDRFPHYSRAGLDTLAIFIFPGSIQVVHLDTWKITKLVPTNHCWWCLRNKMTPCIIIYHLYGHFKNSSSDYLSILEQNYFRKLQDFTKSFSSKCTESFSKVVSTLEQL